MLPGKPSITDLLIVISLSHLMIDVVYNPIRKKHDCVFSITKWVLCMMLFLGMMVEIKATVKSSVCY